MVAQPIFSIDDYLAIERAAEERHEYVDGYIYAMAGESGAHADICVNLTRIIATQLLDTPCRARTKDTKVYSGPSIKQARATKGMFSYPDLVVICGEPVYHDRHQDIVLNPTVIFEVLSDSTEAFDRGEKFHRYQTWNPTLTDYILVSQAFEQVEHYVRQEDGSWSYRVYDDLEQSFLIKSIGCRLALKEIYYRVKIPLPDKVVNT
jgi:Uma2 family endonuclease